MSDRAIDNVVSHYELLGKAKIEVPEWDLVIHSAPITVKDRIKLGLSGNISDAEYCVDMLILKALDENGEAHFSREDRPLLLRRMDASVLARVVEQMATGPTLEQVEKN